MLDRATVERHLDELLASPQFQRAPKHAAFLRFVASCALDGRQDAIKEAVIAAEVYGRSDYDPAIDSLIRVEASRLRKRLDEYYLQTPSSLRITLPKGAYVPLFEQATTSRKWRFPWRYVVAASALAATLLGWNLYRIRQVDSLLSEAAAIIPPGKQFDQSVFAERGPKGLPALMTAATLYQRVLEIDFKNIPALEGLSKVYYRALEYDTGLSVKMDANARRLLELQPHSPEAQFYLGYHAHFHEKNYARANHHFRDALATRPDEETLYRYLFLSAAAKGDPASALPAIEQGRTRLPASVSVTITYLSLLIMLDQFAEAERAASVLIAAHPEIPAAYSRRGWVRFYLDRIRDAEKDFQKCLSLSNGEPSCTANLAFLYHRTARPKLAAPLETRLARLADNSRHVSMAVADMGRRDHAAALGHLVLAAKADDPALPYLRPNPVFKPLRGDPNFERLFY